MRGEAALLPGGVDLFMMMAGVDMIHVPYRRLRPGKAD
jgi:hypothetical protein